MNNGLSFGKIFITILAVCLALGSCHTSRNASRWDDPIYARESKEKRTGHKDQGQKKNEKGLTRPDVKIGKREKKIIDVACDWLGVPYKWGGNTREGVDCSGLVCIAFRDGANILLPRTSRDQANFVEKIDKNSLKPGDLLFFITMGGDKVSHVALYLGENRMIHASSSKGVIISDITENYWQTHFHSCGRVP